MLDSNKIKLGICPISWTNDDLPELGAENTFQQCLSEAALAGYEGTEIGSKYPKDADTLLSYLLPRGLSIASAWFSSFLISEPYAETESSFIKRRDFLHALGCKVVVVSEQGYSIQGEMDTPIFEKKYVMNDAQWETLANGLNKLGAKANEKDMSLVFHHHMGTVVQTAEEVDRLMEMTDPNLVSLLFDTGHAAYSGDDPVAMLKKNIDRVRHVHLKDIRPELVEKVRKESLSFLKGVFLGTFTVPGDGAIDFVPIFKILSDSGYTGWCLVEAEQDPAIANPFIYAVKARKYIREKAGI